MLNTEGNPQTPVIGNINGVGEALCEIDICPDLVPKDVGTKTTSKEVVSKVFNSVKLCGGIRKY
jgi:hypothetical protein